MFNVVIKYVDGKQRVLSSHDLLVEAIEDKENLEKYQENMAHGASIEEIVIKEELENLT